MNLWFFNFQLQLIAVLFFYSERHHFEVTWNENEKLSFLWVLKRVDILRKKRRKWTNNVRDYVWASKSFVLSIFSSLPLVITWYSKPYVENKKYTYSRCCFKLVVTSLIRYLDICLDIYGNLLSFKDGVYSVYSLYIYTVLRECWESF